jgi:ABC-type antimicrobial peptide transport system permease subunit
MSLLIYYGFRNLLARKVTTMLTAGGMALVTFVFTAVLMLAEGLEYTLTETGSPDNAVILRKAAESEVGSIISRDEAATVEVQPEVARDSAGEALVAKESVVLVTLPKKDSGKPTNVVVRGTDRHSMRLRPQVKLIGGRTFRPGSHEIIAGRSIAERIQNASLGGGLRFALTDWQVVGIFDAAPTAFNSEVWGEADQLMSAFRRNNYSAVIARIPGESLFGSLKKRLEGDPRLTVQVKRETVFYREQSEVMAKFIRILGLAMTIFFSVGAVLGAMVTMYSAVANRVGEIGTLRALGFSRTAVMAAFLGESLLLGLTGGVAGLAAGSLLQFLTISTLNWETFSELAFGFRLTPQIVLYALAFAAFMGIVGGLLPALRAAGLEIVDSLRAS